MEYSARLMTIFRWALAFRHVPGAVIFEERYAQESAVADGAATRPAPRDALTITFERALAGLDDAPVVM